MIAIGLMSGTSLDGIDAALVEIHPRRASYVFELLDFHTLAYDPQTVAALRSVMPPNGGATSAVAQMHRLVGELYAEAAGRVAGTRTIDYAAMHGQTVYHDGGRGVTLQVGSPYFLRDRLRATVCFDFRSADCALGGHGAPLVPYVDSLLLTSSDEDRIAINIGGIANLTFLPRGGAPRDAIAFDSGPGNMLIDAFVQERTANEKSFDEDGLIAAGGTVDRTALDWMLADPYFVEKSPKSTGRERFGSQFLAQHAPALQHLSLEDGAATITELTVETIGDAVRQLAPAGCAVLVSGGGSYNISLMQRLRERLSEYRVETTSDMDLRSDAKEAIAFALLGYETLRERPANLPRVTGASAQAVLGAIVPYQFESLSRRMQAECAG
ncbi:MAG: anhydro-N-acetylmuramic acid kinase [Candidatus Baltobacteraceae bacterium]